MSQPKNKPHKRNTSASPSNIWQNAGFWQWVVFAVAALVYVNTLTHDYALDDVISVTMNQFTKKGLEGIPDILTKDSFYGFIGNSSELPGGRWRPLALLTFAIEWEFFGQNPEVSHFINVMLYALCCLMLFRFLCSFLGADKFWIAVTASIVFAVHPVHTEVVANIKSRDEILSLLFIVASLTLALKYHRHKKTILHLLLSVLLYFLALLSKENGVTGLALVPLVFFFSDKRTITDALIKSIPFFLIIVMYSLLRIGVIGFKQTEIQEIMNAPFLLATPVEAFATKIYVLLIYIKLLFIPYPLSYDYSYNQIPYKNLSDVWVITSIVLQLALLVFAIYRVAKRDLLSFAILFHFLSIFIVSNLIVNTGGVLGERFLFQASLGFALTIGLLLGRIQQQYHLSMKQIRNTTLLFLTLISIPSMLWAFQRNKDWENDRTLFIADVKTCPNSARTNNGAGTAWILLSDEARDSVIKMQYLDTAQQLLTKALKIHPTYVDPLLNLGVVYSRKRDAENAEKTWNSARALNPTHPKLKEFDRVLALMYLNKGNLAAAPGKKDYNLAKRYYLRGISYYPSDAELLYNLGGLYFTIERFDSARYYWNLNMRDNPNHEGTMKGLDALRTMNR
jgi:tetratricopeptide (TPR) repeat protein